MTPPRRFRDIVDNLDHIYKLRDLTFTVENSAVLNKLLYGGVRLLASKGSNAVSTLEGVIRAAEVGHIAVSSLLWRLPQLLPADNAEVSEQIKGHMQSLVDEGSILKLPVFHEKQKGLFCLIHALNNLLECRVFTHSLSFDKVINGMINLNAVDGASENGTTGDYLDQAVPRACEAIELVALMLPARSHALHAVHQIYSGTLGAIALRRNHYVAINVFEGEQLWLIDSLRSKPQRFVSTAEMESYLSRCNIVWVILAPPRDISQLDHCGPRLEARARNGYRGTIEDAEKTIKGMWDTHNC